MPEDKAGQTEKRRAPPRPYRLKPSKRNGLPPVPPVPLLHRKHHANYSDEEIEKEPEISDFPLPPRVEGFANQGIESRSFPSRQNTQRGRSKSRQGDNVDGQRHERDVPRTAGNLRHFPSTPVKDPHHDPHNDLNRRLRQSASSRPDQGDGKEREPLSTVFRVLNRHDKPEDGDGDKSV